MEYRVRKRDVSGAGRLPKSLEEAFPDATIRRFLLRAGFRSSSDRAATEVRRHVSDFFRRIVGCMVVMMQHDGRRTFRLIDVKRACEHFGIRMYGYDDMCMLAAGRVCGPEAYHLTELVECTSQFSRSVDASEEPDTEPGARYKKTDFVVNYATWKEDDDMSEPSEWSFSDSDTESEGDSELQSSADEDMETDQSQEWQRELPNEEKFLASLRDAQQLVDQKLLDQESDSEEGESEPVPGQGYYSDYDDGYEPEYVADHHTDEKEEDAKWSTAGDLHILHSTEDMDPAELQDFNVALSALHNATEQCLHRSLTEGSLHFQLAVILKEQEHVNAANQLETELQMQREKVNELCKTIADNKATFKAKELAMQQQIAQLKKQLQGQQDVQMQTPPSLKKSAKRKTTISKKAHVVRKGLSKSSSGSTSVVGALRSRGPNCTGTKKVKVSLA
ncbi:hypothetical protein BBO99_00003316 [Phytophthora kernoviae]|uniref:Uncharacterized protein n=2 Tax=Phytophthora kernoviae TaxID=325452 RepID=A0A3R7KCQ8_9STRA|nr:hypothetical protein G195_002819 [Phytophthora kernoviae 00238/432]KAG2528378.1 hypothetical protein JM16_002925 [Phytophthora kernoviae]KAG2532581.1 hypothetical protein JM18_000468 [Phytophthora kernoviae]RLN46271.1 hypothetical protein BBI17_003319 [Phytophthora kernoviae]RLN81903.1 hypothetical protein BBO99_00003316 [Phytophthora kernoviae]